jgi:hypothetical protein
LHQQRGHQHLRGLHFQTIHVLMLQRTCDRTGYGWLHSCSILCSHFYQ